MTWSDSSLWGRKSKAANASLTLQLFPRPLPAKISRSSTALLSAHVKQTSLFIYSYQSSNQEDLKKSFVCDLGMANKFTPAPRGSRTGSQLLTRVLWHVTIRSVPVTSCRCHVSLDVELPSHPCISSQFNLLVFPGVVIWGWEGDCRQSCSSPFLELLRTGPFVTWHLVSIRSAAPAELFPLQQLLWLCLLVVLCFLRSHHLLYW